MTGYDSVRYGSLDGRRVLITGGASGIGAEMVRAFAAQGAQVGFLDLDAKAGDALARETGAAFAACDLRDIPALQQAIAEIAGRLGPIEVLIGNAARDDRHAFDEITPEYWQESLATNLSHQVFAAHAVLPGMKEAGGGAIVTFGSISWMRGRPGMIGYTSAKAAIHGLTRTLAQELGAHSIRVNSIVPGAIRTERQERLWASPEKVREFIDLQALKLRLEPHHVARMALFLASDEAAGCTGQDFIVDAGLTLN